MHSKVRLLEPVSALKYSYNCGDEDCVYISYCCSLITENLSGETVIANDLTSPW